MKAAEERLFAARARSSALELAKSASSGPVPAAFIRNPEFEEMFPPQTSSVKGKARKSSGGKAPKNRKMYTGAKGGQYYMRKGKRVYAK